MPRFNLHLETFPSYMKFIVHLFQQYKQCANKLLTSGMTESCLLLNWCPRQACQSASRSFEPTQLAMTTYLSLVSKST